MRKNTTIVFLLVLVGLNQGVRAQVRINEILASNQSYGIDPLGETGDWIELVNLSVLPVDLQGHYLSDDLAKPEKWQFPSGQPELTTIPAQGFLLVCADNDMEAHGLHADFKLSVAGEMVVLSSPDEAILDFITYEPLRVDVSYGRDGQDDMRWGILAEPTPGALNANATLGFVKTPNASHAHGFYDQPFDVTLMSSSPADAQIWYTLDGSSPGISSGQLYSGPIPIGHTTCLRAIALKTGYLSSDVMTHSYLFLEDAINQPMTPSGFPDQWTSREPDPPSDGRNLRASSIITIPADYEMDPDIVENVQYRDKLRDALLSLPTMSVVTDVNSLFGRQGIYANSKEKGIEWERPASVELIYPDSSEGFQVNCGIRIHGGAFRSPNSYKHSFRLLFKNEYGPSVFDYPLFGPDATRTFETLVLRAGANDGYVWRGAGTTVQYTRDEFGRRLQLAAGHASAHGMFVHLYLNGLYWGLYNPVERPDNNFSAAYYGGQPENWDALHEGQDREASNGDFLAWGNTNYICWGISNSSEAYKALEGNNPEGLFTEKLPVWLDLTNYIDYLIINLWGGNFDWPWKNYWIGRDQSDASGGFKFYNWDFENTMGNNRGRSPLDVNALNNKFDDVGQPHALLKQNSEYRMCFADRIHRLFAEGGILSPGSLMTQYSQLAESIELAMIAESARWGDIHNVNPLTPQQWANERDWILNTYLPQRSSIVLQQFKNAGLYPDVNAPEFLINGVSQSDSNCPLNSLLTMQGDNGTIWYSLDGTDPRVTYSTSESNPELLTLVTEHANKSVQVPTTGPGIFSADFWMTHQWPIQGPWVHGTGGLGYDNEDGYEGYFDIDLYSQMYHGNTSCYIIIPFEGVDISQYMATLSLNVRYDDGFVAYLNGEEFARANAPTRIQWDSAALGERPDANAVNLEAFDLGKHRHLLREKDNTLAIQGLNASVDSNDFLISVSLTATKSTGIQSTISAVADTAIEWTEPLTLTRSVQVNARTQHNGKWSALQSAMYSVGAVDDLRITEIMYHPEDPNTEYLELTNTGSAPVSLNFVQFTDGIAFAFDNQTLDTGQSIVVVQDLAVFQAKHGSDIAVAGQYTGSLSNSGEQIELQDALGQTIERFNYRDNWYSQTDGKGYGLTRLNGNENPNTPAAWIAAWPNPGIE